MPAQITENFLQALKKGAPYIPIPVASLRLDTTTGFGVYIRVRPDEPAVLYAQPTVPFSEDAKRRLIENRVEFLFIESGEREKYARYLEDNLPAILADEDIPSVEKAQILHVSAQQLVREVLQDPFSEGCIDRTKDVVHSTVTFLFDDMKALRHLLQTASYDYYSYAHSVNVCILSVALAHRLGYGQQDALLDLGYGAILRDIGISQLDESVRNSPGQLTMAEFEIMKQHPIIGEEILQDICGFNGVTMDIVRHHHEKLDGSGYPDGLIGDEISPLVRICTIADVFDALTTNRSYQKALSSFNGLKLMGDDMRRELDMDILREFIAIMGNPQIHVPDLA